MQPTRYRKAGPLYPFGVPVSATRRVDIVGVRCASFSLGCDWAGLRQPALSARPATNLLATYFVHERWQSGVKNCLRRARRAVVRDCATGLSAASARERAIACLSTDIRPRCNSNARSDGNARALRRTLGISADCLTAAVPVAAHSRTTYCGRALCYSGTTSPEPPNSLGKSFNLVSPSRIGSTVSA